MDHVSVILCNMVAQFVYCQQPILFIKTHQLLLPRDIILILFKLMIHLHQIRGYMIVIELNTQSHDT
jgi:hypothetical protein